jgi:mannose-1-phosphate guanylyltransferase
MTLPPAFFVLNGDVCADFPLNEMINFHKSFDSTPTVTLLATEATRSQLYKTLSTVAEEKAK